MLELQIIYSYTFMNEQQDISVMSDDPVWDTQGKQAVPLQNQMTFDI